MAETAAETEVANVSEAKRGMAKRREGLVTSNKMNKTVVVTVSTKVKHPQYGKYMARSTRYLVHDENNDCNEGDRVEIVETRPLSKRKRWRVRQVLERAV